MIAAQKINKQADLIIYGIVSNGDKWEFAYLDQNTITKNIVGYSIFELHKLYQALFFVLKQSKKQLRTNPFSISRQSI